jgi:hypothetical protein
LFALPLRRPGPSAAIAGAFVAMLAAAFFGPSLSGGVRSDDLEFEVGRVADRDVVAERVVVYVDDEATRLRREAQERLVPAVFRYSAEKTRERMAAFRRFVDFSASLFAEKASVEAFALAAQAEYPGLLPKAVLEALHRSPGRIQLLDAAESALRLVLEGGIVSLPNSGLDRFNPDLIEIVRMEGGRAERERAAAGSVATLANVEKRIVATVANGSFPAALAALAPGLLKPFIVENVFFSAEDSNLRLDEARSRVQPLVKRIERGERVIRKGFIVSKDDLDRLKALGDSFSRRSPLRIAGTFILLSLVLAVTLYLADPRIVGRSLKDPEIYLLACFAAAYAVAASFAGGFEGGPDPFPAAIFLPTALATMLFAVLLGPRVAPLFAFAMPTVALVSGFFDPASFLFALVSGIAGAYALQGAERRMDIIRAGAVTAGAHILAAAGSLFAASATPSVYPVILFWAAFNGFACALATLGLLPLFEHALNAATPFRLIELSDLNSPMLKRLLTTAPGTYSHSVTVANLAESACREIGADALMARVGAYYHDIGKMEQPEYFIENQAAYNKHDEIQPRLSATVIRSHVKLGIEKARKLGLPREVVDIIAEHHGNSVISWFYNEAVKREEQVNADDFAYPGTPPKSRESAVVMLADTVEAAVRTLKRPTMSKLDKFVQDLIRSKVDQEQLSESDLTFRDLETIKNAFVRVLAGHYHSRIEYPKLREAVK